MSSFALEYRAYDPEQELLREALCTLGNGYFATRGAWPQFPAGRLHYPGTYLAGGYNRLLSQVAGREVENEDLVNLPNWLPVDFSVDGESVVNIDTAEILDYRQQLDLRAGMLLRDVRLRDRAGRHTRYRERRVVSMADAHTAALEITLVPEDWSGVVTVRSALDGRVVNSGVARYRSLEGRHLTPRESAVSGEDLLFVKVETSQSELRVAEAARTLVEVVGARADAPRRSIVEEGYAGQELTVDVAAGTELRVQKLVALHVSRDDGISEAGLAAREAAAGMRDFDHVAASHATAWRHLWQRFNGEITGRDPAETERTLLVLRVHIFHLLQTVSPLSRDLDVGVPARGWHGEAYRGHVFWDELFIFPLLNLRIPEITRSLLAYRYRRLGKARDAAAREGFRGAIYPWQSGSDGREESQRLHLNPRSGEWVADNTLLQRHVNSAIAYNIWQYFQTTGDVEFLSFYGAEMFLEIARFWSSIATRDAESGRYEIRGVMGPDEYHDAYPGAERPGLNNNAYTNVMAAWVLWKALEVLELLPARRACELRESLGIDEEEVRRWDEVSRGLKVPFHSDGVISQFEGYEGLQEFDWEGYAAKYGDIHRLDRILQAEGDTPNRYKASKQADVLMLLYLFSSDELREIFQRLDYELPPDAIPATVAYYLQRTSHGSTLSNVVHSWVLARSDRARSWSLFKRALESDIADVQGGTTAEGIHLGAMAGTVDLVQRCYTGLEVRRDLLVLNPALPSNIRGLRLSVRYRGCSLRLDISDEVVRVASEACPAGPIHLSYRGEEQLLAPGGVRFEPA
ncbi:MAG: glycoside hydrolase family 65 protein [Gaiellales bacterium]|nr:glycoside hydrolase family 65 protein [Gaiellales bacterium]